MNNKNKKWLLLFLIVGIFVITIGYASFSSRLNLFGSAKVSKFSWTIVIDKWQRNNNITSIVSGSTNEAEEITSPSLTPVGEVTKVSGLEVLFNQPGDRIQYTFDIANKGTMDAELHSWELETPTCTSNGLDVTCKIHREVKCNGIDPTVGSEIKAGESIPCTYTVWYEDVDGTNGYEADPMEAEDLGVEFHYVEKGKSSTYVRQIKVQFNTYGGETIEDIINPKGSVVTLPTLSKEGYEFAGWTDVENGETAKYTGTTLTLNKDITLYPVFIKEGYTITYNLNNGEATNPDTYYTDSENITLNNPTKTGYTFTGWSGTGLTGENNLVVTIPSGSTGNRSYEAHYTPINYTISYELNGGSATNETSYTIESNAITLNNPTKTVTVVGNVNNSGAAIGSNTSAEQTFYGWSGTGLTGENNTEVTIASGSTGDRSYTANYQSVAINLPTANKTGYTCSWYDSNNELMGGSGQSWMPSATSETTVNAYASCVANTYTVSFNVNGGSGGQSSSVTATYGSSMPSISTTAPTKTGYTFGGWYDTSASTGGVQYYTASGASARSYSRSSNVILYARWIPIEYTISYNLDGGAVSSQTKYSYTSNVSSSGVASTTYANSMDNTDVVTIDGASQLVVDIYYDTESTSFDWVAVYSGSSSTPSTSNDGTISSSTGNVSGKLGGVNSSSTTNYTSWFHKTFVINSDTVKFHFKSDGSVVKNGYYAIVSSGNPTTYTVETSSFTLNNPTKDGYTFTGWSGTGLTGNTNTTVTVPKGSTENRSYTANWKANYICKRATTLHTPTCTQSGTKGCAASGDVGNGNTITYGSIGTGSTLTAGEALDCKVSTTGDYTERFYYITDLESNSDYAVLLYSQDTSTGTVAYYSSAVENWHGPQTAVSSLPTTSTWDNISLSSTSRQLYAWDGSSSTYVTTTNNGSNTLGTFDYSGKAGRLLTIKELRSACPSASMYNASLSSCAYLMENTQYENSSNTNMGYWLETPRASSSYDAWGVDGYSRSLDRSFVSRSNVFGARPAIEVLKSKIQLQ